MATVASAAIVIAGSAVIVLRRRIGYLADKRLSLFHLAD
jgi:hypothetical protein